MRKFLAGFAAATIIFGGIMIQSSEFQETKTKLANSVEKTNLENIANYADNISDTVQTVSAQDVAINPSDYKGQKVQVTGLAFPRAGKKGYNGVLESSSGSKIKVDCSKYQSFDYSKTYTVTGIVKDKTVAQGYKIGNQTQDKENISVITCTKPPAVN